MAQFCSQCGSRLPENANVCPQCGKPVANVNPQIQQPQQPQQPYQQPQPQYQQSPYYQRPSNDNGGNKGLLYGIIALLAALLIGGAAWYFISQNNAKNDAQAEKLEQLQQQQQELADKNKELEEQNEKLTEEQKAQPTKIIVQKQAEHAAEHRAVSAGGNKAKVVINGTGVRLRFGPSLNAGYLTWANGQTRAPKKGARLDYTGEDGDWYQVKYLGHTFYVSKEFSYLEY